MVKKDKVKPKLIDYGHEVRLLDSKPLRMLFVVLSGFFLGIGLIGVFLPVLPTTPFILLAAALYARSSIPFYNWIMNHKIFGPPLRDWKERGAINRRSKIIAITMIIFTMIPTIFFIVPILYVQLGMATVGLTVIIFIATRPD